MTAITAMIISVTTADDLIHRDVAAEGEHDRAPGAPLLGLLIGVLLSLGLWGVIGAVAWTLLA